MKLNKYSSAFLLAVCFLGISANAQMNEVKYSPVDSIVRVKGTLGESEKAFITVLKGGTEDFSKKIVYQDVVTMPGEGAYERNFKISPNLIGDSDDEHKITVKESIDGKVSEYSFALSYADTIEEFKNSEDKTNFMSENRYKLGLYADGIEAVPNYKAILSMITSGDYNKNTDAFCLTMQNYMMYDYIQNGYVKNLFKFRNLLGIDDFKSAENVFTADRFSEINEEEATLRLKNKSFSNTSEFENKFNEACVLAVVKNPNGYGNVKNALEYFAKDIGIDIKKGSVKVYTLLQNKDYKSYSDLRDAFNMYVNETSTLKPAPSGGGGGGGGSSSVTPYNPGTENKPETVADEKVKSFSDMEGYGWAKEAVDALIDKDIVSGKEPGKFYPADPITRSEFVKLVVNAFNIGDSNESLTFSDADESRWDYNYISAAYGAGIINGLSSDYFGCVLPITRQDIAVIINRVKNAEGGELADRFADDRQIAEYAYNSVYSLRFAGIINGDESNRFNPNDQATRAEAAVMIYSAIK